MKFKNKGDKEKYFRSVMDKLVSSGPEEATPELVSFMIFKRVIQPWDIWLEYNLNPWDADIVKRVLRNKGERRLDYEKIKHVCDERIRQIDEERINGGVSPDDNMG